MPLGQLTSTAREIRRLYLTPAGKRASASVSLHSPIGGSFALAVSATAQPDRALDQSVFQAGTNQTAGYLVVVSRDGVYMGKSNQTSVIEIWKRVNGAWVYLNSITGLSSGSTGAAQQGVPFAFSADASRLIVGESQASVVQSLDGRARVYTRTGDVFSLAYNINTPSPVNQGYFGNSVDISGDGLRAVVGAPGESGAGGQGAAGRAHAFNLGPTSATLINSVIPVSTVNAYSGVRVCLSDVGIFALTTSYTDNSTAPRVYVYTFAGALLQQINSAAGTTSLFGDTIDLSADATRLIVGETTGNGTAGQVRVYQVDPLVAASDILALSSPQYRQVQTLVPVGTTANANFGFSICISSDGRFIAVGARDQANDATLIGQEGTAYLFRRTPAGYTLMDAQVPLARAANQFFGYDVSVSNVGGNVMLLASAVTLADSSGNSPGVVFSYEYPMTTGVTDEIVSAAAGSSVEKTGLVLDPGDGVYVINRTVAPLNALAVGYSENA